MWLVRNIKNGRIIRGGLLFILAISPLPFGSVQLGAFFTLEAIILALFILWLIRVWLNSARGDNSHPQRHSSRGEGEKTENSRLNHTSGKSHPLFNPLYVVLTLLFLLVLFQLLPIPPWLMKSLSPVTYQVQYSDLPKLKAIQEMQALLQPVKKSPQAGASAEANASQPKRESGLSDSRTERELGKPAQPESWRTLSFNPYLTKLVLYKLLAYLLVFFLLMKNIETFDQARKAVLLIIFLGVFQAFYGLIDFLTGHNHIFFYTKDSYQSLATGTFINRNHLAGYLAMIIPLALAYFLDSLERRKLSQGGNWRVLLASIETVYSKYAFLLFLVVIMAFALIFSQSRMGIISLAIALAFMGFGLSWRRKSRLARYIFSAVVIAVILLGILAGLDEVMQRFERIPDEMVSEGARWEVWQDSLKITEDYPLFGIGAGNYSLLFPRYRSFTSDAFYDHAHNDYIEMLVEVGYVGLAIFLAGFAYYAIIGLRFLIRHRESSRWILILGGLSGLLAISLHGLTDFNMQIPSNALLFFSLLALVYRIMEFSRERTNVRRHRRRLEGEDYHAQRGI